MNLAELASLADCQSMSPLAGVEVSGVQYDSRRVKPGDLFIAMKGAAVDGHDYIDAAIEQGASAVVVDETMRDAVLAGRALLVPLLWGKNSRDLLAKFSSVFFGEPTRTMTVVGVTGTNGKTSITFMLESIFAARGEKVGVIGTISYRWPGVEIAASHTTPESRDLQELFARMSHDGVTVVIMEVSSHALALNRVDAVDFDCAVFTNLTGDHLDFHRDMDDYFLAKKRLFEILGRSRKEKKSGVVFVDDPYGHKIAALDYSYPLVTCGTSDNAELSIDAKSVESTMQGISYDLIARKARYRVILQLSGRFHVANSVCALGAAMALGVPLADSVVALAAVSRVPGRFDVLRSDNGIGVVVDYAHTGDALLKLLQTVEAIEHGRTITVFGCGGDRDKTKRPVMGRIAEDHSDITIVTSDNPRTENPGAIIDDILAGMKGSSGLVIPDREEAIARAIRIARRGDIVVIAGKGHEDYQIIGKERIHFDDREIANKYLAARNVS